jgi:hypothetical protein
LDNLLPQQETANSDDTSQQEPRKHNTTAKQATLLDLFYNPNLRKKTLVILFSW